MQDQHQIRKTKAKKEIIPTLNAVDLSMSKTMHTRQDLLFNDDRQEKAKPKDTTVPQL